MFSAVHFTKTWLDIFHVAVISLGQMVRHLSEPHFFFFHNNLVPLTILATIWLGSKMWQWHATWAYFDGQSWEKLRQLSLWLQFAFQLGVKFGCKSNSPMQFVQTLTVRLIRHLSASFCWTKYISFSSEQPLFLFLKTTSIIQSGYLILACLPSCKHQAFEWTDQMDGVSAHSLVLPVKLWFMVTNGSLTLLPAQLA